MVFWSIAVATTILALASATALLRSRFWWVRIFDFPRLQLAVLAVILLVLQLAFLEWDSAWTWLMVGVTLASLLYQGRWIAPYLPFALKRVKTARDSDPDNRLRFMNANVLVANRKVDGLLEMVRNESPDVFLAMETDAWWQSQLDELEDEYPHTLKQPLDNGYGMLLYSRLPLSDSRVQYLVEHRVPSIHTLVSLPSGRQVQLHCVHPSPPGPTENPVSTERDVELVVLGKAIAESDYPTVVAGDLNDVSWSVTTLLFRKISGLLDPRVGRGMFNTFHARYPFARWPLDHLFHSDDFTVVRIERLPAFGSDHFPLLVELALQPRRGADQEGRSPDASDRARARKLAEKLDVQRDDVKLPGH